MEWKQFIAILTLFVLIGALFISGLERIDGSIGRLESALGGRMDRLESALGGRMDRLESALGGRMDRLESKMDGLDSRLDGLSNEVAEIKGALKAKGIIASK